MGCSPSTSPNGLDCRCTCHKDKPNGQGIDKTTGKPYAKITKQEDPGSIKNDPRIPISGRQVYLLKKSWKAIARNMDETGINMFLSLFEQNEEVKSFFGAIHKDATVSELRESGVLENHVRGVMLTIDEAMNSMDDADFVIDMLTHVGKTHLRFKNFDPQVFFLLKQPFLLAVKSTLGDRYSASMASIYSKAISFILTTLQNGFNEGMKNAKNGNNVKSSRPD